MTAIITHAELVRRACSWLSAKQRCTVVLAESGSNRQETRGVGRKHRVGSFVEIPDAIGWTANRYESRLIECKATSSDFYADARKIFRVKPHLGVGMRRWYMLSEAAFEQFMSDFGGWANGWQSLGLGSWGLLSAKRRGRTLIVAEHLQAQDQGEWNSAAEQALLVAELRRLTVFGGQAPGRKVGVQGAIVRPVELPLACPACGAWHVDDGSCTPAYHTGLAQLKKPHRTHTCWNPIVVSRKEWPIAPGERRVEEMRRPCGHRWTPTDLFPTVGVLPAGVKQEAANG